MVRQSPRSRKGGLARAALVRFLTRMSAQVLFEVLFRLAETPTLPPHARSAVFDMLFVDVRE